MKTTFYDKKTVLVTGGTGSIGSEIVSYLLEIGAKRIVVFSRDEIRQFLMKNRIYDNRVEFIMGDIRDYASLEFVFEMYHIDIVFHTAAMKHLVVCEKEPIECVMTNIVGTQNLTRLCLKYRVPYVVNVSTDKAASPTSVMGASKFIGERIILNGSSMSSHDQRFCCVRFGNVANSRGSVIPVMIHDIISDRHIWISNPNVTRFLMRISDAVKLVVDVPEISKGGEIFILKMSAFRLGDLAAVMEIEIAPQLGKTISLEERSLVQGEKLHEDLLNEIEYENLLESDSLFIVPSAQSDIIDEYEGFTKSSLKSYSSSQAGLLGQKELAQYVREYISLLNDPFN